MVIYHEIIASTAEEARNVNILIVKSVPMMSKDSTIQQRFCVARDFFKSRRVFLSLWMITRNYKLRLTNYNKKRPIIADSWGSNFRRNSRRRTRRVVRAIRMATSYSRNFRSLCFNGTKELCIFLNYYLPKFILWMQPRMASGAYVDHRRRTSQSSVERLHREVLQSQVFIGNKIWLF